MTAKASGRLVGLAYLVIIVCSSFGYLETTRLLDGGAQAVAGREAANAALFALAMGASTIGLFAWIAVGLLVYRLTSVAGRIAGLAMLAFVTGGVAMNLAALCQILPLAGMTIVPGALGPMIARYNRILDLAQLFSGLWLLPFGWLVYRTRIAPRLLGLCLMVGGFGYLSVFAKALAPGLAQVAAYGLVSGVLGVAVLIGEAGICLWLLVVGAQTAARSNAPARP